MSARRLRAAIAVLIALAAGALAVYSIPVSAQSTATAPACVPDTVDATAKLAGTPLLVTPAPGSRDAMPQTQLSLLGVPAGELSQIAVNGSVTGVHGGVLKPYSQGDGASFVPRAGFEPGETVTVSGIWTRGGVAQRFAYDFTVGDPDPITRLPEPGKPAGPRGSVLHFASAPSITPAALDVTLDRPQSRRDGDIFLASYPGPGATGPEIFDSRGQLVWFKPLASGTFATNVRVQRYRGQPVLTWWQGTISKHGFGLGVGEIYSSSYRHLATIEAGDGLAEDLHELQLEPNGTALITAWKPLYCDLAPLGGPALGAVYDASFQEIDLRTGLVRYEWDSLDHVPLTDSYMPLRGVSPAWPYDWFHLNSIASDGDGSLLISARSTWTLYDLDASTGTIRWQLGGRRPSFTMGPGTLTAWQHDARPLGGDEFSVFDNLGPPSGIAHSHGLVLAVNTQAHTVNLVKQVAIATPIFAQTQGDLQRLPDGDWWIGWGNVNESSDVAPSGTQLFEAHTPPGSETYRSLRFPWSAHAPGRPQVAVRTAHDGRLEVHVSWNGATDVARWRLLAGPSRGTLRTLGSAASTGFETVIAAPPATAAVELVALDADGRALGSSGVIALGPRG